MAAKPKKDISDVVEPSIRIKGLTFTALSARKQVALEEDIKKIFGEENALLLLKPASMIARHMSAAGYELSELEIIKEIEDLLKSKLEQICEIIGTYAGYKAEQLEDFRPSELKAALEIMLDFPFWRSFSMQSKEQPTPISTGEKSSA